MTVRRADEDERGAFEQDHSRWVRVGDEFLRVTEEEKRFERCAVCGEVSVKPVIPSRTLNLPRRD